MSRKTPSTAAPDDEGQPQPVKRAKHEADVLQEILHVLIRRGLRDIALNLTASISGLIPAGSLRPWTLLGELASGRRGS